MPPSDGDVIDFDYEMWIVGLEGLADTTLREAAEKAGTVDPNARYGPVTAVLGAGRLIPGLEKALKESTPGTTKEVEIPPGDAYGQREAKHIETIPIHEFKKNDIDPRPGLTIRWRDRAGIIMTVGGGRVRVDFNPALAGKTLRYRFTLRKVAHLPEEKLAGLLRMHFPAELEWKVAAARSDGKNTATVEVPTGVAVHERWATAKIRTVVDANRYTDLNEVRFSEVFELPGRGVGAAAKEPEPPSSATSVGV